jgi:hypothetical protein
VAYHERSKEIKAVAKPMKKRLPREKPRQTKKERT